MADAPAAVEAPAAAPAASSATPATTAADTSPVTTAASEPAAAPEPASQAAPETYEVTIDGQKLQVTRDELLRGYQRGAAARKRFEEAARAKTDVERQLAEIKANPWAVLEKAGINPDEISQARVMELIRREQEQAELAKLPQAVRDEIEAGRKARQELAERQAREKAEKGTKLDAAAKNYVERWNKELPAVMEKAGLPRTAEAAHMVLGAMKSMAKAGVPPDLAEAAQMVKDELYQRNFSLLGQMTPDALEAAIGKDALDKLQAHLIQKAKGAPPAAKTPEAKTNLNGQAKRWLSQQEWERLYNG